MIDLHSKYRYHERPSNRIHDDVDPEQLFTRTDQGLDQAGC